MAHGKYLIMSPVHVIPQESSLLVYLFSRIGGQSPASVKFMGISTVLPQCGQTPLYTGISMVLIRW